MNDSKKAETFDKPEKSNLSQAGEDDDFELTADMMVHEFDDETTLNEEEDDIETNEDELADLAKEGEMPLEDLYALYYGGGNPHGERDTDGEDGNSEKNDSNDDQNSDDAPKRNLRSMSTPMNVIAPASDSSDEEGTTLRLDERKKPRIGEDYQVTEIPDIIDRKVDEYNASDEQVWAPWKLPEDAVAQFLKEIAIHVTSLSRTETDSATFIQDNEDALFLLKQCNNDIEEALRRFKSRPLPLANDIQVWSEEECRQFESGLTIYGKDFYLIHVNNLKSRSVRDIVKFYYLWKKSERYDHFTAKTRLGKRKETLPANVTDYMDRLLDETDNACTSDFLNYNGASHVKYTTIAHNAALIEHLRQLEASIVEDSGGGSKANLQGDNNSLASAGLTPAIQAHVNAGNELGISESDINQVLSDLSQSSSEFG